MNTNRTSLVVRFKKEFARFVKDKAALAGYKTAISKSGSENLLGPAKAVDGSRVKCIDA